MMTLSSTSRSLFAVLVVVLLVSAPPVAARAAVKITDVNYNPAGTDQGHEWIRIANTGDAAVSIAGYRLYEGGVNHKITVYTGTSTLPAGAEILLVTDPGQYVADNPDYVGMLFKSSFSLSNTSETIALKDAALKVVDSYTYTAPPVVKAPVPAKTPKAPKQPKNASSTVSAYAKAGQQASVASAASLQELPTLPSSWLYGLGFGALLMLGVAVALYIRPATNTVAGEFELE